MKSDDKIFQYSFYRFIDVKNKKLLKKKIDNIFRDKLIRGTILIADEGINGSVAGKIEDLDFLISFIRKHLRIRKFELKKIKIRFLPFNKFKVRIKKEIVSMGIKSLNVRKYRGITIEPNEWDRIIQQKNIKLIDMRNTYETKIGKFKKSIDPKTKTFKEFPSVLKALKLNKNDKIAMYCTGGIRCEKASSFLKMSGYKNVVQLRGGILNYLDYKQNNKGNNLWSGECFVFDKQVTINKNLKKGKYNQCYGCRHPLTHKEMQSNKFIKGVSCPYCYKLQSNEQIESLKTRQKQIEINNSRKIKHTFRKIELSEIINEI